MLSRCVVSVVASAVLLGACSSDEVDPSPEVFILDGLVVAYGAETPCYGSDGAEEHALRCMQWGEWLKPSYPVVHVRLDPFVIEQHEVTNAQYAGCVSAGRCTQPWYMDSFDQGVDYYYNASYGDYPVQQVTWQMASNYCEFVGRRLPTDAEWQRVAQGSPVLGTHRTYPAEGIESFEACQDQNADISSEACNGRREFLSVTEPGGDVVDEGYDAEGAATQVYHLFGNVSEFTADFYQGDVTCQAPLPEGDLLGGEYDGWDDCMLCEGCDAYTSMDASECQQECKFCEACAGTRQDGTPYRPDGYDNGPLDCQIDCWGETREQPVCQRWSAEAQPLAVGALSAQGTEKIVRGGHVGISSNSSDLCRYRADYREKRMRPEGSADTQSLATSKGAGFRCARDLTDAELSGFASDPRFVHLAGGAPEAAVIEQADYVAVPVEDDWDTWEAEGDGLSSDVEAEVGPTE